VRRARLIVNSLNNVRVSQLSESRDLSEGCGGNSFIVTLELHFFHRNEKICLSVSSFVNHAIGSLPAVAPVLLQLLISLHGTAQKK
jgi:hypothetical protein